MVQGLSILILNEGWYYGLEIMNPAILFATLKLICER